MKCAYCGGVAGGNFSIHRDGFGDGPEVPLCDRDGSRATPTCEDIWDRIAQTTGDNKSPGTEAACLVCGAAEGTSHKMDCHPHNRRAMARRRSMSTAAEQQNVAGDNESPTTKGVV